MRLTRKGGSHQLQSMSAVPGLYFLTAVVLGFGVDICLAPSPRLSGWLVSPAARL